MGSGAFEQYSRVSGEAMAVDQEEMEDKFQPEARTRLMAGRCHYREALLCSCCFPLPPTGTHRLRVNSISRPRFMAQLSIMGPPPSPRETRRSGRRSAPAPSTSTSKSPDSDQPPKQKDSTTRPALNSSTSGSRNKRPKQEDVEDGDEERRNNTAPSVASNGSTQGASNGKSKRKGKEKDKQLEEQVEEETAETFADDGELAAGDEEEQGITRCVCGSNGMPNHHPSSPSDYDRSAEDDPDAGEFMIQCEGCKVWQHGPCMGFMTEDQVDDDDYYCEQCKPELHTDLLR